MDVKLLRRNEDGEKDAVRVRFREDVFLDIVPMAAKEASEIAKLSTKII